jgi:hypothetical protein
MGASTVLTIFKHAASNIAALLILFLAAIGSAHAQVAHPCPDDASWNPPGSPAGCTKEIRIWNNTDRPIYVVLQASIQQQIALGNCPKGDVWLQRALDNTNNCYPVNNDYQVYVNPKTGIPPGRFAALNVPWWSRAMPGAADPYVDWWRAGRIIIFDGKAALDDSYGEAQKTPTAGFATAGVTCKGNTVGNAPDSCRPDELQIYQVSASSLAQVNSQTPFQLNEYTFADVGEVTDNGADGGELFSLNQNYNVSNVDQVYLPLALEPIRETPPYNVANIGYMGTTISVADFRERLAGFAGTGAGGTNPANWPIYNNPVVDGKPKYPDAGIRVPSTYSVLAFYTNPSYFKAPLNMTPTIIPSTPPALVKDLMTQWTTCTTTGVNCPESSWYQLVNQVFLNSYEWYITHTAAPDNCVIPSFLAPVTSNPPMPALNAYLSYIYGWVPFNFGCKAPDLPTADLPPNQLGKAPIDYIALQYNYEKLANKKQWFNPYTQFIHADAAQGGLAANAYAFSIDDSASVQNNPGDGLIFAVGGDNGLPNKTQVPPPVPVYYPYYDFVIGLGSPGAQAKWAKYGLCSADATRPFPNADGGYSIGVNPDLYTFPCTITFTDTENRKYQIKVLTAKVPPLPIWEPWDQTGFDPKVMACPTGTGVVPPDQWCSFTNETARPTPPPPFYNLSARAPL